MLFRLTIFLRISRPWMHAPCNHLFRVATFTVNRTTAPVILGRIEVSHSPHLIVSGLRFLHFCHLGF